MHRYCSSVTTKCVRSPQANTAIALQPIRHHQRRVTPTAYGNNMEQVPVLLLTQRRLSILLTSSKRSISNNWNNASASVRVWCGWESLPTRLCRQTAAQQSDPTAERSHNLSQPGTDLGGQNGNEKLALTKSASGQLGSWKENRVSRRSRCCRSLRVSRCETLRMAIINNTRQPRFSSSTVSRPSPH